MTLIIHGQCSSSRYFMITSLRKKGNFRLLKPLSNLSNNKLKIFANLAIWLLAIVLSCPILVYQQLVTVGIKNVYVKFVCAEQYPDDRFRIVYAVLTFVIAFVIPLLTLSYFHYKIKCFLNAHILRFELSREKLMNNGSSTIKTISSKSPQSLFMSMAPKRNSEANYNYYSMIDLNLFNSSDLHSSPTQTRDGSPFNSDLEKGRLPIKANHINRLDKSRTLSNNFQFDSYLPVYRVKLSNNKCSLLNGDSLTINNLTINKISPTKALSAETVLSVKKNCASSCLSLSQLKMNCSELIESSVNNSISVNNSSSMNNSSSVNNSSSANNNYSSTQPKSKHFTFASKDSAELTRDQKRRPFNKRSSKRKDSLGYRLRLYRSLSDSNLFDLNQPFHNSFLHELNPPQSLLTNLHRKSSAEHQPSTVIVSPSFSSQAFNLDYLRLINFDFNQRSNTIIRNHPETAKRLCKPRRSEQLKIASLTRYSRFSCFLKRLKQFHYLNKELQRNQKVTFLLVMTIVIFAISWLPLNVYNLYFDFNHDARDISVQKMYTMLAICHIFAMSSAITNGILYGLLNTNIQKELIKLFKNCLHSKRKAAD